MVEQPWERIPAPIPNEEDRRTMASILAAHGLEVRIVKLKLTTKGAIHRYLEYREQQKAPTTEE